MRWLPHATLQDMNHVALSAIQRTRDQVLNGLSKSSAPARPQKEEKANDTRSSTPHYVVLITDETLITKPCHHGVLREDPTKS